MIKEGNKAPAFSLPASTGGKLSLKDFAGKTLIMFFYPKDNTPGCTTESCEFRDVRKKLEKKGVEIVGVSKDSLESHENFVSKYGLNFPLLSDEEGKTIEKYGAWGEKNNYGKKYMGIIRTTVVINPDGRVKKIFPKVRVKGHVDKVIEALAEE